MTNLLYWDDGARFAQTPKKRNVRKRQNYIRTKEEMTMAAEQDAAKQGVVKKATKKAAKKQDVPKKRGGFQQVSPEEQLAALKKAAKALASAKTKADVVKVWQEAYLIVGHRKLGRLLLGKSPEDAMSRWGKAAE